MSNASEPDFDGYDHDSQKPMVTRAEYEQARAVLDALPSGYYVKCAGPCGGWYSGGTFVLAGNGAGPLCERCK